MSAPHAPSRRGRARIGRLRAGRGHREHWPVHRVRLLRRQPLQRPTVMESLRAGYERLRRHTDWVGDKVMKQALNSGVGSQMKHALTAARQYTIGGRTVVEERQISEGGFAFVWAARDSQTNEELALKKIVCQDRASLAMARREVDILERLPPHPNLVKYYGHTVGDTEGRAKEVILLFELCTGGHLLHLLERNKGVLKEERILGVLTDLCTAVALLHTQTPPIQHRDLKVENVLLGSDGSFKLCDFGSWNDERSDPSNLDKQQTAVLQEQIERYTTMMYRPPEMVDFYQQFVISEKVDIWMLGCILYTLMFCRHPFQDESNLAIANARYHLPSSPRYSERLRDLTHWLLARDPAHRPSATELLDVLQHFGDGAALPLPGPVVEKRDQLHRLYCEQPSTALSGRTERLVSAFPEPRALPKKFPKPKHHHKSSKRHVHRDEKTKANEFWAQADFAQGSAGDVWPPAAVPEPSRAWATFEVSADPGQDWSDGGSTPHGQSTDITAWATGGSTPRRHSPQSRRASSGVADSWLGPPVPSAGSRTPPPGETTSSSPPPVLPLAFSGRSTRSARSTTSLRSAVSVHSGSGRTERSYPSESHGAAASWPLSCSSSPMRRSNAAQQLPAGQDRGGDFWALAAAGSTSQTWDPFVEHVQWPPSGSSSVSPRNGAQPQAACNAETGELRGSSTPMRQRLAATGCSSAAGFSIPCTAKAAVSHCCDDTAGIHSMGSKPLVESGAPVQPVNNAVADLWSPWDSDKRAPQHHAALATSNLNVAAGVAQRSHQIPTHTTFTASKDQKWPSVSVEETAHDIRQPWSSPTPASNNGTATVSREVESHAVPSVPMLDLLSGPPLTSAHPEHTQNWEPSRSPWDAPHGAPPAYLQQPGGSPVAGETEFAKHFGQQDAFACWSSR